MSKDKLIFSDDLQTTTKVEESGDIEFILGKGNQSAICGGVKPVKIVSDMETHDRNSNYKLGEQKTD